MKKHFGAFGDLLAKAHERVKQASDVIEDAGRRSRTIETKLKKFEDLPGTAIAPSEILSSQSEAILENLSVN